MIISLKPILFLFLVLTVWSAALPAPRSLGPPGLEVNDLAARTVEKGEVVRRTTSGYYAGLGTRTVEEEEKQLVPRKGKPKVSPGAKKFFGSIGHLFGLGR